MTAEVAEFHARLRGLDPAVVTAALRQAGLWAGWIVWPASLAVVLLRRQDL